MRDTYAGHWSLGIQQEVSKTLSWNSTTLGTVESSCPQAQHTQVSNSTTTLSVDQPLSPDFGNIRRFGNFLDSNYSAFKPAFAAG